MVGDGRGWEGVEGVGLSLRSKRTSPNCGKSLNLLAYFKNDLLKQIWEFLDDRHGLTRSQTDAIHRSCCVISGTEDFH